MRRILCDGAFSHRELERRAIENDVMRTYYIDGKDDGLKEGYEEGMAEGMEKGAADKAANIARSLKSMGLSLVDIVKATGLTEEQISAL